MITEDNYIWGTEGEKLVDLEGKDYVTHINIHNGVVLLGINEGLEGGATPSAKTRRF